MLKREKRGEGRGVKRIKKKRERKSKDKAKIILKAEGKHLQGL